jgi:hypothetical protein
VNEKYAAVIKSELDEEQATTTDFRSRSLTIVTTSGGLVTLLAGLIAIAAGGSKTWEIPDGALWPLGVALGSYVVAAFLALSIHIPRITNRATIEGLEELLEADDDDDEATMAIADLQLATLTSMRVLNGERSWFLLSSIAAEIVAIAATGLTAWRIISSL